MNQVTRREFLRWSALAGVSAVVAAGTGQLISSNQGNLNHEILIQGGLVYDGSESAPRVADVGIKGDRIVAIGELTSNGAGVIDARGKIVTPGFIDVHTHVDRDFTESGNLALLAYVLPEWKGNYNYLYQGVTTVVSGNCGYGHRDTTAWFDELRRVQFGSNVYHLAPHGEIRMELFGKQQPAELSPEQLDRFKKRIALEMEKGAVGFSTGLAYGPGNLSSTEELIELAKVVKLYGGLYATHIRTYTSDPTLNGQPGILEGFSEAIEIGRSANIPVQLSHLQIQMGTRYPNCQPAQVLDIIDRARQEGLDVTADQYPYAAGMTLISALLPDKFKSDKGVLDEYKTPQGREEIKNAIRGLFIDLPPEKILLLDGDYAGKTLAEGAQIAQKDPVDAYVDQVTKDKSPNGIVFQQDMNYVKQLALRDYVFTASDGLTHVALAMKAHPRMYGTFPRKIRQFALDEKLIDLNSVIRSMTSLPAAKFRMRGRGRIAGGYYADVAVIDLDTIADLSTYEKADVFAKGILYLLVNGVLEINNGQATGERGGKPLKRGE